MKKLLPEVRLKGVPVSEGIAIGQLYFLPEFELMALPEFSLKISEVEKEILRYRQAISSSRSDLHDLQSFLLREGSSEAVTIIDAHIQMLEDPLMTVIVEEKIRQMRRNTESVFRSVMMDYEEKFSRKKTSDIDQRMIDVKDLSQRILRHLHPVKQLSFADLPENTVIFTKELIPSDAAEAISLAIGGFITQIGGGTSHAALIARANGVPYVSSFDIEQLKPHAKSYVIVDGRTGELIINPDHKTIESYLHIKEGLKKHYVRFTKDVHLDAETLDGCKIEVLGIVENSSDMEQISSSGVAGVGLLRSEFFIKKGVEQFSEEEQYALYKKLLDGARQYPVVVRVFDLGGDKGENPSRHLNPALGKRAIRFLLSHMNIFRTQLRALLRANTHGNLHLLLPLISDVLEIRAAKEVIKAVGEELRKEGCRIKHRVKVGAMIEVPSAVMTADILANESDFLSIGTNDLVQYTLAIDRTNQEVNEPSHPAHPSILRMIKKVVVESNRKEIPVGVCGEIASNPLFTAVLLGLGIRQFSCSLRYVPFIKNMIRAISLKETIDLCHEIAQLDTAQEIYKLLEEFYAKRRLF